MVKGLEKIQTLFNGGYNRIAVGGPIGIGKTTFVNRVAKKYNADVMHEMPKDKSHIINVLLKDIYDTINERKEIFYGNKEAMGWAYNNNVKTFAFQMLLLGHRYKGHSLINPTQKILIDRSILEDSIFGKALIKDQDLLTNYLKEWDNRIRELEYMDRLPDFYIILKPAYRGQTLENIKQRNRPEEMEHFENNKEYFQVLEDIYVINLERICKENNIPYIIITSGSKEWEEGKIEQWER